MVLRWRPSRSRADSRIREYLIGPVTGTMLQPMYTGPALVTSEFPGRPSSMVQWNISLELAAVPLVGFVTPTQHGFIECKVPERTNTR